MRKIGIVLLLCFALAGSVRAETFSGSLSDGDGLLSQSRWRTAQLSWTVDDETNPGYWTYSYTFSVPQKPIRHVLIETSPNFHRGSIKPGSTPYSRLGTYGREGHPSEAFPGLIHGLLWRTWGQQLTVSWSIVSDRGPMWGDWYAKSDWNRCRRVYAYNSGFGDGPADPTVSSGNNGGWVLVPDQTLEEEVLKSVAANEFNQVRGLVAPGDTSPAMARIVDNHVEVSSESWTYALDSAGHQVFRPSETCSHLEATFDTDLTPMFEEWLELPVDPTLIAHARELVLAAFGINYFDNPAIRVTTKKDVLIARGPDMELPSIHEGRTYVIFSNDNRAGGIAETSILYTPDSQPLHLESSAISERLSEALAVFQQGLSDGAINGIHLERYDPILRLGTFYCNEESRFHLTCESYRGEAFVTQFPVGPCEQEDYTCNPWYGYVPLGLCEGVPLPWPMWVHRTKDEYLFHSWYWWNRCGRVGAFQGNYDWSTGRWGISDRRRTLISAFDDYEVSGGVDVQINHHVYCEDTPHELEIDTIATHGKRLEDRFYEDLESCHVAMLYTHGGPMDPDPFDGVPYFTFHLLRGFRDGTYDDWFMLHQPGDDGLGRGRLRHLILESCASMNWIYARQTGHPENLIQDWFRNDVADGIRTVCGSDEVWGAGSIDGWPFFRHYNINASISHSWAMQALELDTNNHPVTVAYGATLDEAASILFDGRFTTQRGNTGWIIAMETWTVPSQ